MSMLDGKVTLDGEARSNNKNNNGGRDRRNNGFGGNRDNRNSDNGRRTYDRLDKPVEKLDTFFHAEKDEQAEAPQQQQQENDRRAEDILRFCDDFTDNVNDMRQLKDVILDEFPDAVRHIKAYYSQKNGRQYVDAVNRLINTMAMSQFANTLSKVLEGGVWIDDGTYDKCWRNIAFAISTALETSHEKMHNDVIRIYAANILPRMWKPEINEIVTQTGVTRELVLDLIIAIPMVGAEWNGSNIDAFYGSFLDKMLQHAEDNMDVLNWEVQGMLYDRFFDNKKTGLKIIGKYLTSESITTFESDVAEAVYKQFIKMLYNKLDGYDIKDIAYVFKFVSGFKKEHESITTIFNATDASTYENVRKGLLLAMEDQEVMKHLA